MQILKPETRNLEIDVFHSNDYEWPNAFATNFTVSKNNVKQIVADGRARWKIENENNNILKNNGYNLKHKFGHGKKYLSAVLLTSNRGYVTENSLEISFVTSIGEMIIEGFGYRSDRIYRKPPGGIPCSTRSPSQMPRSE